MDWDDDDLRGLLKGLRPRKAPPSMDEAVLAAAGVAAGRGGRPTALRMRVYVAAGIAAALLLVAAGLILVFRRSPDAGLPGGRGPAASRILRADRAAGGLAARVKLLEARLSRLRTLSLLSEKRGRHLLELDALRRELRAIDSVLEAPPRRKIDRESGKRTKTEGGGHVEVDDRLDDRVCARPGRAGARRA